MFNLFFRRYVPGFRVGPDGVPGFDIDDNGLPRRATASFDGTFPESAAQQYPDAAPTQTSPSISFGLPGAASWVLPTPLPGFRVSPQGDVPGFNVGPQYGAPGFNVDENGDQQQEIIWSDELPPGSVTPQDPNTTQTPILPANVDDSAPPAPPSLPRWPYQFGTMLPRLPTVFDSRTERPSAINPSPGPGSATAPGAYSGPAPGTPPQPVAQQAIRNVLLQRPKDIWPYAPADGVLRAIAPNRYLSNTNFSLMNAGGQTTQQQMRLPQYQQAQRTVPPAPLGTGSAMAYLPEKPGTSELERRPEQEFSQSLEADRRLKGPEGRQPTSDQRSLQPLNPAQSPSREDDLGVIGPAQGQALTRQRRAAQIDQGPLDAGGLPNGGIIAGVGPARTPHGIHEINAIHNSINDYQSRLKGSRAAGGISPSDSNIHLVGDGDERTNVRDLERTARHRIGVDASIATAVERGFKIIIREEVATDVPGFDTPRFYDYIMQDPLTGKIFGVEVKTTIYDTVRLDRSQVEKDAVVIARGAKVRKHDVWLDGVSYSTYCFDCENLDIRSRVLQGILQDAGVIMTKGYLPGDIPP
jgi:hypothetical protein